MVEYIRGSRVDDYAPLFALSARVSEAVSSASERGERQVYFEHIYSCQYSSLVTFTQLRNFILLGGL